MESFFTAEFFSNNRNRLKTLFSGTAPIIVTANGLLQRNGDSPVKFRQDSNFWYLTGLETPGALLVLDKDKEYIILPDISPIDEIMGAPHNLSLIKTRSGIDTVLTMKEGWGSLAKRIKKVQNAATFSAAPAFSKHYGFYTNPARKSLMKKIRAVNPEIELMDLRQHLMKMRMVKQVEEIAALQAAVDITVKTLRKIEKRLDKYGFEYEIEADLSHGFRSLGAKGHAFDPIVASGKNTCHIHYQANNDSLKGEAILYIDSGAEVENYSADITRTYILDLAAKREKAVMRAVEEVAAFARAGLKPGISIRENEKAVEQFMGEKLRELGLIKSITHESVRKYYTHACSHYLGLDTHDTGDYDAPLEKNMVLTVEPGIYIPEEGIGARIEDDVLVTKTGIKVLSQKLYT
jgi:Xaa-Pro aminopeptidase